MHQPPETNEYVYQLLYQGTHSYESLSAVTMVTPDSFLESDVEISHNKTLNSLNTGFFR